jgi:hypothetical protein
VRRGRVAHEADAAQPESSGGAGTSGSPARKGERDDVLNAVVAHFDDVYRQLNEQVRRMTKIQQQVHLLIGRDEALETKRDEPR